MKSDTLKQPAQENNSMTPIDPAIAAWVVPGILLFAAYWVIFG